MGYTPFQNIVGGAVLRGTYASRPSPGVPGRIYYTTDTQYLYYDTGATWIARESPELISSVTASSLTTIRGAGRATTKSNFAHGMFLQYTNGAASDGALFVATAPSTPFTFTVRMLVMPNPANFSGAGICLRESSTGKATALSVYTLGTGLAVTNFTASDSTVSPTTFAVTSQPLVTTTSPIPPASAVWFRVTDDGTGGATALTWSYSVNGIQFVTLLQTSRTAFLLGGANQIGLGLFNSSGATFSALSTAICDYYQVT